MTPSTAPAPVVVSPSRRLAGASQYSTRYLRITPQVRDSAQVTQSEKTGFKRGVVGALHRLAESHSWPAGKKKADRYDSCGRAGFEVQLDCIHAEAEKYYVPYHCDLRACAYCAAQRAARVSAQYAEILNGEVLSLPTEHRRGRGWKLVTLTRRNPGGWNPDRLYRQVRETRRLATEFWHETWGRYRKERRRADDVGVGAIYSLEVSPSGMVHVHMLLWGRYWPKDELVETWRRLCGDGSYIVDVRAVDVPVTSDPREALADAVREVLKYATKDLDTGKGADPEKIAALEYAFHGTRRLTALGIFYGHVADYPLEDLVESWVLCPVCLAPGHVGQLRSPRSVAHDLEHRTAAWHPFFDLPP